METINQRIAYIIETKERSKASAAQRMGYTRSYITYITTDNSSVGIQVVNKILNAYPDVNARWLITGEGIPFETAENVVKEPQEVYGVLVDQIKLLQKLLEEKRKP